MNNVVLSYTYVFKRCRQNGKQYRPSDWTAHSGAVWSGCTLFAQTCLSEYYFRIILMVGWPFFPQKPNTLIDSLIIYILVDLFQISKVLKSKSPSVLLTLVRTHLSVILLMRNLMLFDFYLNFIKLVCRLLKMECKFQVFYTGCEC